MRCSVIIWVVLDVKFRSDKISILKVVGVCVCEDREGVRVGGREGTDVILKYLRSKGKNEGMFFFFLWNLNDRFKFLVVYVKFFIF